MLSFPPCESYDVETYCKKASRISDGQVVASHAFAGAGAKLRYNERAVNHDDLVHFLKTHIPNEYIDLLLIDVEGGEFGLLKTLAGKCSAMTTPLTAYIFGSLGV